tara:strand:- start:2057 stop:2593 length:537 start_codon:yes stop_codon:yes gene_type:complete
MVRYFKILFLLLTASNLVYCKFEPDLSYNDIGNDSLYSEALNFRLNGDLENCLKVLFEIKCCHLESNYTIAEIYLNDFRNYNISLDYFNKIISFLDNNDSDKNLSRFDNLYKKSLFMTSYIYSNYLGMYSRGYDGYNLFLDRFPNDDLRESVIYELEQLNSKEQDKAKFVLKNKKKES